MAGVGHPLSIYWIALDPDKHQRTHFCHLSFGDLNSLPEVFVDCLAKIDLGNSSQVFITVRLKLYPFLLPYLTV